MKYWLVAVLFLAAGCEMTPEQNALRKANSCLKDNRLREAIEAVESGLQQQPGSLELQRLRVVIRMVILLKGEQFEAATVAWRSLPPGDPALANAFHHRDPLVRSGAARLIAEQAVPISCKELVRGLEDPAPTVRRYCARALAQKRGCNGVRPLFRSLRDDNGFVRAEAAKSLGDIGDVRAAGWLVSLLDDEDGFVRYSVTVALRQVAGPANRDLLVAAYARANSRQQFGLALALAKLKEPIALEALGSAGRSQDSDQRRRAAEAFGDYTTANVTNPLVRLCKDSNPAVQIQAAISLRKVLKCVGATATNEAARFSSDLLPGE